MSYKCDCGCVNNDANRKCVFCQKLNPFQIKKEDVQYRSCPDCRTSGPEGRIACGTCHGNGIIPLDAVEKAINNRKMYRACPDCLGPFGKVKMDCSTCEGTGWVPQVQQEGEPEKALFHELNYIPQDGHTVTKGFWVCIRCGDISFEVTPAYLGCTEIV